MQSFESYQSKSKLIGLFLLNIGMIAVCIFCVTLDELEARIAGWAGIAFFGIGLFVFPKRFFQTTRPKIVMDDAGIHTGSSTGTIEWSDIIGFRVDSINGTKFLSIFVSDKNKYLKRMSLLARKSAELQPAMGMSEITICFVGLSPGLEEACQYLTERKLKMWQGAL